MAANVASSSARVNTGHVLVVVVVSCLLLLLLLLLLFLGGFGSVVAPSLRVHSPVPCNAFPLVVVQKHIWHGPRRHDCEPRATRRTWRNPVGDRDAIRCRVCRKIPLDHQSFATTTAIMMMFVVGPCRHHFHGPSRPWSSCWIPTTTVMDTSR